MRAVNLVPAEQRGGASRGAGRSQGGAYVVLGILAGLALLAVLYGSARHKVSSDTSKAAALETKVQAVQANTSSLAPYTSFVALREQRVDAVSQLVNSRFDWAHAFHELGRVLPANVSITSLTGTVGSTSGSGGSAPAAAPASSASSASPAGSASSGAGATPAPGASAAGAGATPAPGASAAGAGAKASVASSTPPGSVPTFILGGCAKSQSVVALTLDRLRLMDGVSSVALQSSVKSAASSGSATATSTSCPGTYPVFSVQVVFDALPASTAKSAPASTSPVSSSTRPKKSTGGS
jgi:hypothetical protein